MDRNAIDIQFAATKPTALYLLTKPGAIIANIPPTTACATPILPISLPDLATPYTNASVMPLSAKKAV